MVFLTHKGRTTWVVYDCEDGKAKLVCFVIWLNSQQPDFGMVDEDIKRGGLEG